MSIIFVGQIDKIKNEQTKDNLALTLVHEAGHAVLYALNFNLAPVQLKSKVASTHFGGFTFSHQIQLNSSFVHSRIQTLLGGLLAEKLIFGTQNNTPGSSEDLRIATELAAKSVRRWGV